MDNQNPSISIPVIFYDGEQEITLENVQITPLMTFKLLQSTLSNKIGISPNHITIYLDRNNLTAVNINYHHRRRHPVTSKFDFTSLVVGECFFWVVLKRGRRNRRRRNHKNPDAAPLDGGPFVLLRRSDNHNDEIMNWEYLDYVNKMRYLMSLNLNSDVYNGLINHNHNRYDNYENYYYNGSNYSDEFGSGSSTSNTERVFCDVCYNNSNGGEIPFHWCKNDVIVSTGFKSIVGPIAPPNKN